MTKTIIIYGAGGLGREVKSMLPFTGTTYNLLGFLDDSITPGTLVDDVNVLGGLGWLEINKHPVEMIVAIGNPKVKADVCRLLSKFTHVHYPVLIHDRAQIQDIQRIKIGAGSIICAGAMLTTSISIGKHALINLNTTVGHDTWVGDYTSVMPGCNLAGSVTIGDEVLLGSGSNILNNVKVGDRATVGAGSVVNRDVPNAATAAGVPARVIQQA
jgi:sugar O-acyltransferase (sialic acid O-acetyltransferase NeuD family)